MHHNKQISVMKPCCGMYGVIRVIRRTNDFRSVNKGYMSGTIAAHNYEYIWGTRGVTLEKEILYKPTLFAQILPRKNSCKQRSESKLRASFSLPDSGSMFQVAKMFGSIHRCIISKCVPFFAYISKGSADVSQEIIGSELQVR